MDSIKKAQAQATAWFSFCCYVVYTAFYYYTSMQVIFYTEIALIMLCCMDFTLNVTLFSISCMVISHTNYALSYTGWATDSNANIPEYYWDHLFTMVLALYLLESAIRIYYCIKLAYYHEEKVKNGDLCCMKCHTVLTEAAMSGVYTLPHIISSICAILYFSRRHAVTANATLSYHEKYFANNPYVGLSSSTIDNIAEENNYTTVGIGGPGDVQQTMYYAMAKHVIEELANCRFNTSASVRESTLQLLYEGSTEGVLERSCAVREAHCRHGNYYLQLTIESVHALINYSVIRCLFSHVIKMHQFEVYNLQRRLQNRTGSRLIQVYKVMPQKSPQQRASSRQNRLSTAAFIHLPRQAIFSLVNLGINMAAKLRPLNTEYTNTKDQSITNTTAAPLKEEYGEEEGDARIRSVSSSKLAARSKSETDEEAKTWSVDSTESKWHRKLQKSQPQRLSSRHYQRRLRSTQRRDAEEPAAGRGMIVYNRRSANINKVNFEHFKIAELFPGEEAGQQEQEYEPSSGSSGVDSPKSEKSSRRVNNSIFTDETFYSLDV